VLLATAVKVSNDEQKLIIHMLPGSIKAVPGTASKYCMMIKKQHDM